MPDKNPLRSELPKMPPSLSSPSTESHTTLPMLLAIAKEKLIAAVVESADPLDADEVRSVFTDAINCAAKAGMSAADIAKIVNEASK